MSESIFKLGFGSIDDTDESLKGKTGGGVFGLNQGFLTKFEYNPSGGKDGANRDVIDITFSVGEREFRRRIFDVTRVFKGKNELTDQNSNDYIKIYNQNLLQVKGIVVHTAKATGVTQTSIDNALRTPPDSFAEWATVITSLVPAGFEQKPIDGFLEYQWEINSDQDRTFLELPKNMKGGLFLIPSITPTGSWKEEREWIETDGNGVNKTKKGLRYIDNSNNVHPFIRDYNFMTSNKAIQQTDEQDNNIQNALNNATPVKSSW